MLRRAEHTWFCHLNPDRQVILDDLDTILRSSRPRRIRLRATPLFPAIWKPIYEDSRTEEVLEAAEKAGVHPAIAAGRWRFEHSDYRRFSNLIGRGDVKTALLPA